MKKTQDEPIREFKLKDVKFVFDPKRSTNGEMSRSYLGRE